MINLDWDLVYQHLDFEDVHATFELLIDCRRIDEAFELVGLGDTVEKRDLWFNRKMRYVSSLRKKIERLEKSHGDIDPTNVKINLTWRMSLGGAGIANTLGGLGLVDEATAHYHTMFSNLTSKEDLDHRCDIVQRLFWMGRYEETRTLCKQGFSLSEIDDVAPNVVATQKRAHIRYWMGKLKKRYPDPLKRLHVAAGIVNSPFCGLDDFDLRLELASIEPDPKYVKSGSWDFRLAQVHQFHGDVAKYESHLQIAQQAGYSRAADQDRVKQAVLSENWDQVVEFYDSPPNNTTVYAALLAAEAYRQLGDVQSSALRTAFAFAIWEENYGNSGTTSMLETIEKQHLATKFLKLQVYRGDYDGSTASTERYRSSLADSQLKSDPEAAVNNIRIVLFDYFASNYRRDVTYHWAGEMIKFKTGQAQGLIKEGKLDEALELALQCDKFAPGDPGLGEDLIPAFDEAGGAEQAQQLFEQLSGFYFDLLAKYPESALHHNNYAWLCACAERRKDHMLRHAEIAVEQRPDSSSYLDTLATVYFLIGENEKAIELCRRCIAIYPSKQHYRDQLKRFGGDQ